MWRRGQEATVKEGPPMANARPCLVARDPRVSKSLQIRGIPMKGKEWKQFWKQLVIRFRIRNRIISSDSTEECSNCFWKQLARGETLKTNWWDSIFLLQMHKEFCIFIRIEKTWNFRTINTWPKNNSSFKGSWKIQIDVARRNIKPEESF